jgi:hypothetical protein
VSDEVSFPNFKQHQFKSGVPNAKPFTSETARAANEKSRAMKSVKDALMSAFDKLGNEAFFVQLGRGSAEDKRCLAMILAKLLPIEVAGALDATLTVKVVTMVGDTEIDITRPHVPKDAVPALADPATVRPGRAPEDGNA